MTRRGGSGDKPMSSFDRQEPSDPPLVLCFFCYTLIATSSHLTWLTYPSRGTGQSRPTLQWEMRPPGIPTIARQRGGAIPPRRAPPPPPQKDSPPHLAGPTGLFYPRGSRPGLYRPWGGRPGRRAPRDRKGPPPPQGRSPPPPRQVLKN